MKLLVLDFDGVISDSAPEVFAVALRTYRGLAAGTDLPDRDRDALYRDFLTAMPLGNRAEDFGAILAAAERGVALPDQDSYWAFRAALPSAWLAEFHRRFYRERRALRQLDPAGWLTMQPPYRALLSCLRRRAGACPYAIATAKDRDSVLRLLESYGVRKLFPEDLLLDKETGVSKVEHLRQLARCTGFSCSELTFVDDKVNHLEEVAALGTRCVLAAWGYNGPRELQAARARGYPVCELATADAVLFGAEARPAGRGGGDPASGRDDEGGPALS